MKKLDEYFGILGAIGTSGCKSDSLTYKTLCSIVSGKKKNKKKKLSF